MTEPAVERTGREMARPRAMTSPNRRLSDKVREAMRQACVQGHRQIAERLRLTYQAIAEEESGYLSGRRAEDWERP